MASVLVKHMVAKVARELLGDKALRALEGVRDIAINQSAGNSLENFQALGKRALIAVVVATVAVQVAAGVIGHVVSKKAQEKQIEKVVRQVLEEERQKAAA